ncbi:MAG: hypothetical protein E6J25_00805 [Chloroflexi bacterium]|nr:MAG: hypothetical protein E6J25_00805 [Chloroflexota bacterium]
MVVLELAQPGAELLQTSLEVVNLATGNAGAPLRSPPKPVVEGGIGLAQYGLHPVGTVRPAHPDGTAHRGASLRHLT